MPQVLVGIALVVSAATSLRGAGRAVGVSQECGGGVPESPSWSSTRLWLLRLGYYKLTRAKEPAEDWVWIVDHVGQMGQEKGLVIVGIGLSPVPVVGESLPHANLEPIASCPVTPSKGELV